MLLRNRKESVASKTRTHWMTSSLQVRLPKMENADWVCDYDI
jgi:hypothetical protein